MGRGDVGRTAPFWRAAMLGLVALVLAAGCGPSAPWGSSQSGSAANPERAIRTLGMAVRYEPESLAAVPLRDTGSGVSSTTRLFNAELDLKDGRSEARPYLAEALPKLHTDSWK